MQKRLFKFLDPKRRRPSIAQIGGFRPEDRIKSWFGGHFLSERGSPWPVLDGKKTVPLLQIKVSELPVVPAQFSGKDIIQVFFSKLPQDLPACNGEGFLVKELSDEGYLAPAADAPVDHGLRACQLKWLEGKLEGPTWEEAQIIAPNELTDEHATTDDPFETYGRRYAGHTGTKVGGYATYIQDCPKPPGAFLLQIASEEKPRWTVSDGGNMYLYLSDGGECLMDWDCY